MLKRFFYTLMIISATGYAQNNVDQFIDSLTLVDSHKDKARLSQDIAWELKDTDWDRTLKYLDFGESESLLAEESDESLASLYVTAGDIYYAKDVLDVALDYFQKAYNIYSEYDNKQEKFKLENNLAIIYAKLNNKDKALYYFNKVYSYQTKVKDSAYMAQVLNNIGTLYLDNNADSSEIYYQKALEIVKRSNNKMMFAYLYTNLGRANFNKDDSVNAQRYFDKAIAIANSELNNNTKSFVYQSASQYYLRKNQNDSAIFYATKTVNLLKDNTYSFGYQNTIKTLYTAYLNKNDYKKASNYFELYLNIRDSINVEEKAVNVERLKLEQEYKSKDQIRGLEEDKKSFKYYVIGLSLMTGLLILVIMLIKYRNRLTNVRLDKKLIEAKRKELNATLELKNRVLIGKAMTEIHRTEITHGILEDLKHVKLKAVKKETQQAIDYILGRLERESNSNIWNEFEVSFEQVHEIFYKNLIEKHPLLTSKDKRLCALLILNLTSKEISQITGQSFKAVENARTRLRKKLELTNTKADLSAYLNSLN